MQVCLRHFEVPLAVTAPFPQITFTFFLLFLFFAAWQVVNEASLQGTLITSFTLREIKCLPAKHVIMTINEPSTFEL